MITAAEREKGFREALAALLERHGAELDITDDAAGWGMHRAIAVVSMQNVFDDDGNIVAEYVDFNL